MTESHSSLSTSQYSNCEPTELLYNAIPRTCDRQRCRYRLQHSATVYSDFNNNFGSTCLHTQAYGPKSFKGSVT